MGNGFSGEIKLGIGDAYVPLHAHVAYFLESEEDFAAAVGFLAEGLAGGDGCILVGDEKVTGRACEILSERGFDPTVLKAAGKLSVLGGAESGEAILEALDRAFAQMMEAGSKVIRMVGMSGWLEQGWPSVRDLVAVEAKVSLLAEKYPCVILCLYDLRTLPGIIMRYGALQIHPLTIRGRSLEKNPFRVPVEQALSELEEMTSTFCDFERTSAERKKNEKAVVELRNLSTTLQSTLELDKILEEVVHSAAVIVEAECGVIAFCATEGLSGYLCLCKGEISPQEEKAGAVPGRLISASKPHLSNDPANDPYIDPALVRRYGVRNVISTPILDSRGEMIGFLEMHNKMNGAAFNSLDQHQIASAAQIAALAARNANAFREISQMGARLRDSTERFRHLVDGLDAIVWEAEAGTFRFTYVSRQAEAMLGYPLQQWLEPGFWAEHIHPADRERAVAACRLATAEGKDHRFSYRAIAADGREVWLRDHVRIVFDHKGKVKQLRGLMVDISESMSMQEAVAKSEARFRSTFVGAGIGMALVDAAGRLHQSNPELQAMLGYPEQELSGLSFFDLTGERDSRCREQFEALMAGKLPRFQVETRLLRKDGSKLCGWVTFSAVQGETETQYAIGMVEDITERKEAEAEVTELLAQVQKDAAELEKRVAERTAQLEEINSELDSFAHSVSHDLRAPLRAMQGFAEILLEDGTLGETERFEYLKRILAAAQGMDKLIQNLLAYSRLSRQEIMLQPVSLDKVVRDAAQQLELASGGKKYQLEIAGELPEVVGHHAVLVQVVLNLMTNGIKFVPAGVTPKLRIWAEERHDLCRLYVQDNGIGIPPEHQERIFKIFERLHSIEDYPGTGVGLAIVRKAVTRLGGKIGVNSRVGEGSRFWIEFPKGDVLGMGSGE